MAYSLPSDFPGEIYFANARAIQASAKKCLDYLAASDCPNEIKIKAFNYLETLITLDFNGQNDEVKDLMLKAVKALKLGVEANADYVQPSIQKYAQTHYLALAVAREKLIYYFLDKHVEMQVLDGARQAVANSARSLTQSWRRVPVRAAPAPSMSSQPDVQMIENPMHSAARARGAAPPHRTPEVRAVPVVTPEVKGWRKLFCCSFFSASSAAATSAPTANPHCQTFKRRRAATEPGPAPH